MNIPMLLLDCLEGGAWHTGTEICARTGLCGTGIQEGMSELGRLGLSVESVPDSGFRLEKPLILLREARIRSAMVSLGWHAPCHLYVLDSVDSTNRFVRDCAPEKGFQVCVAEWQTAGRGRMGRSWYAPLARNLCVSVRFPLRTGMAGLGGLSLVASLAVLQALGRFHHNGGMAIKWPNDLLWQGRKLCGSLIEILPPRDGLTDMVIGIGLNVNADSLHTDDVAAPWCSMQDMIGRYVDRNQVLASILVELESALTRFDAAGFRAFQRPFEAADYLRGKKVSVSLPGHRIEGTATGVNHSGHLCVRDEHGKTHAISAGNATLREH